MFETFAARLLAMLPDDDDDRFLRSAVDRLWSSPLRFLVVAELPVEGFDDVFAIPT